MAAQRAGWPASLLAATLAFTAATAVLNAIFLPAPGLFLVIIVALVVSLFLMPGDATRSVEQIDFPAWDLPARMVVATAFVVVLTAAAPLLGARLAGLLAPFTLYATVLAVFAHRIQGSGPAVGVLHGLLLGLFALASVFLTLASLLPEGVAIAFAAASVIAVAVQGASLVVGRRVGLA